MSTVGPTHAGNNEDLTIGKNRPNKPLPTPPSETEMTAPQSLAPKKPLPKIVESDAEYTGEIETFDGAQGLTFDEDTPPPKKPEESPSTRSSQQLIQKGTGQVFERQYVVLKEHQTDLQQQKSFSLINSLKSFTTMVSNSRVGKFFSEIGPKIKASAFGIAIRGVFTKREAKSHLATMLSDQSKSIQDRFRNVFKDPSSKAELKAYCEKTQTMEVFDFIENFVNFEKNPTIEHAEAIRLHFLGDANTEAKSPINIDNVSQTSEKLKKELDSEKISFEAINILTKCFRTLTDNIYTQITLSR